MGGTYPYSIHKGVPPPGRGSLDAVTLSSLTFFTHFAQCLCAERPNVAIGPSGNSKESMSEADPVEGCIQWRKLYQEKHEDYEPLAIIGRNRYTCIDYLRHNYFRIIYKISQLILKAYTILL